MNDAAPTPYFLTQTQDRFASYDTSADFLHPEANAKCDHYSCTETQYLGFSIPEENIHAVNYLWHHPKMKTVMGGTVVFQGYKPVHLAAELIDMRNYMSDSVLANDLHDYQFDNGYRAQVIEPLKKFRVSYNDPKRDNSFDVTLEAIMPLAMWPTGRHFEQICKTSGELVLRGKKFKVDGFTVRDRSWGEARKEETMPIPCTTWMVGSFNKDFGFNCNALDHPDLNPIWKDSFNIKAEQTLLGGWMWVDGQIVPIVEARKLTHYDRKTMFPTRIELNITIKDGRKYEMVGTVTAACPFNPWINVYTPICLTRWECNGQVGFGESQDVQWNDFVTKYAQV